MPFFISVFMGMLWSLVDFLRDLWRRLGKWVMRGMTKQPEIQRIIYGEPKGYRRIKKAEECLNNSRTIGIKEVLAELTKAVQDGRLEARGTRRSLMIQSAVLIAKSKGINMKIHARFITGLSDCLEAIVVYKFLSMKLLRLREIPYNSDDASHEAKLMKLWSLTSRDQLSDRKSKQWQDLGFQGNDPATDFRGAGLLSLDFLLHLAKRYPEITSRLLDNSRHPLYSYPWALLCIQICYFSSELCRSGFARTHFYNRYKVMLALDANAGPDDRMVWGQEVVKLFYDFTSALVIDFNSLWFESKPRDIMEYGRIKGIFDNIILRKLNNEEACFLMEVRTI